MTIEEIKKIAKEEIAKAENLIELDQLKIKYLGRNGYLTDVLKSLKDLAIEEKRKIGSEANALRQKLEEIFTERKNTLARNIEYKPIDISIPGKKKEIGHIHPISKIQEQIEDIFSSMSFTIAEGPEIETEFYNFDALNIPANHPARDMWDTFWLKSNTKNSAQQIENQKLLLRTHTSPVQIHYMENHQLPIRMICPGKCFRYEASDASHDFQFYQFEGLMIDKDTSLANFKFVISAFFKRFFNKKDLKVRIIPSYFPFVEPGLEVDISCPRCDQKGCPLCKNTGWLEVAGAGMVHPEVFKAVGYNPKYVQGFAFGFGLERMAMIKYNIPDIRLFNSGDLRFIKQF